MFKKLFILIFISLLCSNVFGQNELEILTEKLNFAENDNIKDSINQILTDFIKERLENDKTDIFKNVKNISYLRSDDKKFSIVTWPVLYSDFKYKYFGFIRYYENDFGRFTVEKLTDQSEKIINPERQILNPSDWYGAFYYKLIYKKYKKKQYYVLLGWDGNDDLTNKKIIDLFYIDENNEPKFGKNIFESENGIKNRLIFEYREGIAMNLSYDEHKKMIIWDHLSPSKSELKGHYEYYGPDLSFDGLFFEKGVWKYFADVDLNN